MNKHEHSESLTATSDTDEKKQTNGCYHCLKRGLSKLCSFEGLISLGFTGLCTYIYVTDQQHAAKFLAQAKTNCWDFSNERLVGRELIFPSYDALTPFSSDPKRVGWELIAVDCWSDSHDIYRSFTICQDDADWAARYQSMKDYIRKRHEEFRRTHPNSVAYWKEVRDCGPQPMPK
ncbi:MAG TPA: hypothetical protein VFF04_05490 [Candidatus Babeliales bacterium]|nr:hypothetical protein [Candidatus Babeliales bacterium]